MQNLDQWMQGILNQFYQFVHALIRDNYDYNRFGSEGESSFRLANHTAYLKFFIDNYRLFFQSRQLLADETSRMVFDSLVLYRLLGHLHVKLGTCTPEYWKQLQEESQYKIADTQDGTQSMFGALSIFEFPFEGERVRIKSWGVFYQFMLRQYYLQRNGINIRPERGDIAIDAGACFGDTAVAFAASVGESGHVYTFDFMPDHLRVIRENIAMNNYQNRITVIEQAVGEQDRVFGNTSGRGGFFPGMRATEEFPMCRLDSFWKVTRGGQQIDFIKMDIEGSELAALKSGEELIRTCKPKLAISAYHRIEDLIILPQWIAGLGLGYQLYLDHYTIHSEETVLYAKVI